MTEVPRRSHWKAAAAIGPAAVALFCGVTSWAIGTSPHHTASPVALVPSVPSSATPGSATPGSAVAPSVAASLSNKLAAQQQLTQKLRRQLAALQSQLAKISKQSKVAVPPASSGGGPPYNAPAPAPVHVAPPPAPAPAPPPVHVVTGGSGAPK
jgi:hypothetical protein